MSKETQERYVDLVAQRIKQEFGQDVKLVTEDGQMTETYKLYVNGIESRHELSWNRLQNFNHHDISQLVTELIVDLQTGDFQKIESSERIVQLNS